MITVQYRRKRTINRKLSDAEATVLTKVFETEQQLQEFLNSSTNHIIISTEYSGREVANKLNKLFGC